MVSSLALGVLGAVAIPCMAPSQVAANLSLVFSITSFPTISSLALGVLGLAMVLLTLSGRRMLVWWRMDGPK